MKELHNYFCLKVSVFISKLFTFSSSTSTTIMSNTAQSTVVQDTECTKSISTPIASNSDALTIDPDGNQQDGSGDEEEDWDDSGSEISQTSTVKYQHEPFDSFREKARKLIQELWPRTHAKDVLIERVQGGGFNRIVAVTIFEPTPKTPIITRNTIRRILAKCFGRHSEQQVLGRYILRIPRKDASSMPYNITALAYAARLVSFPVPDTIVYDKTNSNALGQAYMLQKRLPGKPLADLWPTLNFEQKKSAVRDISEIICQLYKVKSICAGIVSKDNTGFELANSIRLEQMPVPRAFIWVGTEGAQTAAAVPQTTRDFLISLCERQRQYARTDGDLTFDETWDSFAKIINKMHQLDLLSDKDCFHFYHGDFYPRNLLARITSPTTVEITGVLDWDFAAFAPKFMSARPPFFLWQDEDAHEEDDEDATLVPECAEKAEFKRIFEDVTGSEITRFSYLPEYVIARRMYFIMMRGIRSGVDLYYAEQLVEEFEELHPSSYQN
jgi:aminoglycoside phosphotransferase (APT) family kinase protein